MESEDCPSGFVKDQVMNFETSLSCRISLTGYLACTILLIIFRIFVLFMQVYVYFQRRERGNLKRRVPLPIIVDILFLIFAIILFLGSVWFPNIMSIKTGISAATMLTSSFFFNCGFMLSFLKMVHLGKRVLPKNMQTKKSFSKTEEANLNHVRKDKILALCWILVIILQGLTISCAFALYANKARSIQTTTQIGLISVGFSILFLLGAGLRQNIRLRHYIDHTSGSRSVRIGAESEDHRIDRVKDIAELCMKMKKRDHVYMAAMLIIPMPCILAGVRIIPMWIEFILVCFAFITLGTFLNVWILLTTRSKIKRVTTIGSKVEKCNNNNNNNLGEEEDDDDDEAVRNQSQDQGSVMMVSTGSFILTKGSFETSNPIMITNFNKQNA